jgi:hypothetical protein
MDGGKKRERQNPNKTIPDKGFQFERPE